MYKKMLRYIQGVKMESFKKIMSIIGKVFIICFLVLLIIIVTCNIALTIQKNNGSDTPNIFGIAPITISGNEMQPILYNNDYILIKMESKYAVGDVVTYKVGNSYCTQKIVEIKYDSKNGMLTEYIVANPDDKAVTSVYPSNIYGKLVLRMPGFAPVVAFFQSALGVCLIVVVLLFLIFLPEIIRLFRRRKENLK